MTSAGAVAKPGTARKSGEKKSATRKKIAVVTAVSPVRPPSTMPAEDST